MQNHFTVKIQPEPSDPYSGTPGSPASQAASAGILTPEATAFLTRLQRTFGARREELLSARLERAARLDAGEMPDFLPETREIRDSDWTTAEIPQDLIDRRVEITGPADRKMIINALNSGASVFMADFEDADAPPWANNLEGQINLRDAVRRTISFDSGTKEYRLEERTLAGSTETAQFAAR